MLHAGGWGPHQDLRVVCKTPGITRTSAAQPLSKRPLRQETFLVHAGGAGEESEDHLIRRVSALGFRPKIIRQKASREYIFSLVALGYGIAITTSSAQGLLDKGVKFVRAGDGGETVALSAVWLEHSSNPALRKLLNVCDSLVFQR
ncbi:LysR substrate-binding domain-containing protein [Novosphingobium decolorationis]|uniref:LysR substrate-binding domain-containing protein n=1 Tax=Novosphingobium decolorationis TaxID=2698673 RepID=UPI003BB06EBC